MSLLLLLNQAAAAEGTAYAGLASSTAAAYGSPVSVGVPAGCATATWPGPTTCSSAP